MTCARCEELDRLLGLDEEFPPTMGLTNVEARMLGMLGRREICRAEAIHMAIWGGRPESDMPAIKSVDVYICKLRKKLRPLGIEILTRWGQGFYIDPENKRKLRALCEQAEAA